MTPYRKKLIEVALPLAAINAESAREKSIRHGHPSTLRLWRARRPLAACRAVLFSSLVDDPDSDPHYRKPQGSLKPWREVVTPHPDVASGRYKQAEFAADLWQVYQKEGTDEYKHPTEFFRRTFPTEGLRRLLSQAILRLTGQRA